MRADLSRPEGHVNRPGNDDEALVMEMFEAVEHRNVERLFEIYDPQVEFDWPPSTPRYGGVYRGEEVPAMHVTLAAAWDPLQPNDDLREMKPRLIASGGGEVVVEYTQAGVGPSGERLESPVIGIYTVADGRVTRLRMFYFDPDAITSLLAGD